MDASVGITIDNTLPGLTVTGPDGQTFGPGATQTWSYSASDATSRPPAVQCSVTPTGAAPSFAPCAPGAGSHSVGGRPEGSYTARFRATDGAGNARDVVRTFSIDATPPSTRIDSGPADGSSSTATSATFTFSSDDAAATFGCRVHPAALTPGAFGPCTGPGTHTASGFAPGSYTFEVVATDAFGNADATPEKRDFTVNGTATGTGSGTVTGTGTSTGNGGDGRIHAVVQTFFTRFGARTRVDKLTLVRAPEGATVTMTCKSKRKGCPFKRAALVVKNAKLALGKRFKHRKLRAGAVITIVVSKPGLVKETFRFTLRPTKFPAVHVT